MKTKTWFRIHSFTGVITGLLLFVICWSGTFATVAHELDWLVTPAARVEPAGEPVSAGVVDAAVRTAYPEAEISWIEAPLYRRSAAQVVVDLPAQDSVRLYVNPYTGELQGQHSYFNIQRFFRSFHMNLFIPFWGKYLVTLFALTMLTSLVAALYFYKRWWTRFFRFRVGGGRVFWSELHKATGLWSLWFVLIIGLTGVWYLFEAARADFGDGKLAFAGDADYAVHPLPRPSSHPELPALPLDELLAQVRQARPDLEIRSISPGADALRVEGQAGHLLVRDRANQVHLDARTGEVLYDQNAGDYPLYWRWSDTADPLHFGDFGGLISKLVWFCFGVLLSGLILTGTYLHAQRLTGDAGGRRHRWPGTGAAILVTLGVLAATVPYGLQEAREYYGPLVDGDRRLPSLAPGVRLVVLGWIAATLAVIGGWLWLLLGRPRRREPVAAGRADAEPSAARTGSSVP